AGDPAFVPEPNEKDIDGEPRVFCTRVDIGADEYVGGLKPTADAGPDQFFKAIVAVTLDGTGSFVCDSCAVMEFSWTQAAGPDVTLSDAAAGRPTFVPEVEAEYRFELVVSDGLKTSEPDQVLIVVGNRPPVADAGPNTVCRLGQQVHLDGTRSYDPDPGDPLSYAWRQLDGPNVVLHGTDTLAPYYDCNQEGVYAFELVVSDGLDHSRPSVVRVATVEVTVNQQSLYIEISNFNHNGDVSDSKVIYAEGSACDFGWTNECRDLKTGTVISFDGGGLDTQPKIDGELVVWFGGPEFGEPWYHEPLNTSVLVRDLAADENIILREYTMSECYTHPVISGRKVVWLEHHNLDTQPLGSPQANNWWNTPYDICGADITNLDNPVYFTIDVNVGRRDPYACLTYHSDFDDVIDICGNLVVWEADGDIYGADITDLNGIKVFPVCTSPARQYDPAISGNIVVWVDERNDGGDIYGADISDTENVREFAVITESGDQKEPVIDGCLIVYVDVIDGLYGGGIKACCLTKHYGALNIDLAGSPYGMGPAIDGETVIWQDSYFGKAQGMVLEVSYSVPDGKVRNLATGKRYDYFQHAINAADPPVQIVAAPAVYEEDFRFKGKNLTVSSTEPNDRLVQAATVLRGTGRGPVVAFTGGEDTSCVLAGFTITGGYEGISCLDAWPAITNCKVTGNTGAGIKSEFSQPRFLAAAIVNCTIVANEGDGVWARGRITPALTNCLIAGNKGAGVDTHQLSVISNCTIVENGLAGISSCNTIVTNSIVWGNCSAQIVNPGLYSVIAHSDVQGGYSGTGNINVDPCFVEPGYWDANGAWVGGDYHLLGASECVDLGDNAAIPPDIADLDADGNTTEPTPCDFDGKLRLEDGDGDGNPLVDMGAYEYFVPPVEVAMRLTPQAVNPESKGNWVKAHFVLPEGYVAEDVDANKPARISEPFEPDVESEYMNVFVNEDGFVEIEAAFDRGEFCGAGIDRGSVEVTVVGSFTTGQKFYGTETVKITTNYLNYLADLAYYWLEAGCGGPDWCDGVDLNQDATVNFVDLALFDGCCIEVIAD
ncbi:MAG: PKD domain-containing protein, partial [Planctomycetota bacterium]